MDTMEGLRRSQYCAEVSEADTGKEVILCGWVGDCPGRGITGLRKDLI